MTDRLLHLPEDWERALAVVAHPDDMEYGAASAVARWCDQGKDIRYLLVTDGEVGIDSIPAAEAGPLRREEQRASCAAVGVSQVEFLGLPDGLLEEGVELRRDLTGALRRHRPRLSWASTIATAGVARAGTIPTTGWWDVACSTPCGTLRTAGSS